ncbi:MAG: tartrate dehydrogenase [Oscillospiraceae bacterium]|nr:tartrate dehydrogenase [Oscillospiraceae bacterium]
MTYRIAVVPGDGVGPEVIAEGVKILNTVEANCPELRFEYTYFPFGCEYYLKHGRMIDDDGIERLSAFDAIYLGAVGYPGVPDHISLWGLLLKIRKSFDQYVNLRPIKLLNGAPCPIKNVGQKDVDMLFIRENTEGEYAGEGEWLNKGTELEVARQVGIFTRKGTERVIRYAFELAKREQKTLTSITKGNALNYSMVFWDTIFRQVALDYPDIKTSSYHVDAASMLMIRDPGRFQVVVASNLFGDILTDLGAEIAGGIGLAAGANLNPERDYPSMFEPVHGSAPDIAGQEKANPIGAIWSVSQMLDHFERPDLGEKVLKAVEGVLKEGIALTPDLAGKAKTAEVGDAVAAQLASLIR